MTCNAILIVEDEKGIRENLQTLLELEGYSVITASNGEEGLQVLQSVKAPCLILLDLLMPIMNGVEFLEAKARDDKIAQIPVCVVSGVAQSPDLINVSAFVKKPIDLKKLPAFVHQHCASHD